MARTTEKGAGCPAPFGDISAGRNGPHTALLGNDVNVGVLLGALHPELDDAMCFGEQGVVGADTDIHAGAIHSAALADQDVSREHVLAAEFLDAEPLGMRIAAVSGAAACFFVCHEITP